MNINSLLVSNSEADTFLTCQRKHYYAFGERLQPKSFGPNITRGNLVHAFLESYYNALKEGNSVDHARNIARRNYTPNLMSDLVDPTIASEALALLEGYIEAYREEDMLWEYLAVEHVFVYNNFPFKVDLVKRHKSTGEVILVDHKTLRDFYSYSKIEIYPQLPKYAGALQQLGYKVDKAEYNILRHRSNAVEKYRRMQFKIPEIRSNRFMWEHGEVAAKILQRRAATLQSWEHSALRTANSFNCNNCWFLNLCSHDLHGYNGREALVDSFYEPNTYGYDEVNSDE